MNKKKILVSLLILSLLIGFLILYYNSSINITPINLQERIELKLLKDNEGNGIIFKPGVTCTVKGSNLWEVKVIMPENLKNCDLAALSILPGNKFYEIWLTIPNGNLSVLNDKKVKFLYVEKSNNNGSIDFSGLAQNKDIDNLCLMGISEKDAETLSSLPSLVSLSINFSQQSLLNIDSISKSPKIKNLSFTNVKKFVNPNESLSDITSLGLSKCFDYSIVKFFYFQELTFSNMDIDIDYIVKYQANTLKTLILRKCHFQNIATLEKIKCLDKLIVINCSNQDNELIDKLPIKNKKIVH